MCNAKCKYSMWKAKWNFAVAERQPNFIVTKELGLHSRNHKAGKHSNLKICTPLFMTNDNQVGSASLSQSKVGFYWWSPGAAHWDCLILREKVQLVRKQKLHFASHIYISHHLYSSAANGSVLPRQHPKQSRSRMANHTSNSHRKDVFNYQKATQMDDASISMWRDDEQWTKCE